MYLALFLFSLLLSFILTWCVRRVAVERGWVVIPASHHIHDTMIPRLGGVAIYLSFIVCAAVLALTSYLLEIDIGLAPRTLLYLLLPATLVFLVGLYDDFRPVNAYVKFSVQIIAGLLLFLGGYKIIQVPLLFGEQHFEWLALPFTILWVLWITNAFNLIDGLDGLAAGSALFSTLTVFIVSLVSNDMMVALLTLGLAGAILGFLRFNFNPATIFLGDSGSLFIGFMLSALALAGRQKAPTVVAVAIPIVSFGLPVLETTLSVFRRWMNGQPLFSADREHIHHKLLDRGFSQRQVVIILYGVSALFGLLSLFLLYPGGATLGVVLFVLGAGVWIGLQRLGYHEFFELSRVAQRTIEQKRIIKNNLALRRAARALAHVQNVAELRRVLDDAFKANAFDGYHLDLQPLFRSDLAISLEEAVGGVEIVWRKQPHNIQQDINEQNIIEQDSVELPAANWFFTLDLCVRDDRLGSFTLYRAYSDKPLLVDVNLLISDFHTALAEAVYRFSSPTRRQEHTLWAGRL